MRSRAASAAERNNHILSTLVMGPRRGASYILNHVLQIVVNVLILQALLRWKWPGNDSKAVRDLVFNRKIAE